METGRRMRSLVLLAVLCAAMVASARARRSMLQTQSHGEFPNYPCTSDPSVSPYRLEGAYTTSPSANGVRVCFTGAPVQPCPSGNKCCSQADFYKLELRVRPTCRRAIRSVTVNGLPAPLPTFEQYGSANDKALFKMPRMNLTTANVTGAKICITLRDPCPNMQALCPEGDGRCMYAIGQSGSCKCCPVNTLGIFPPPPPPSPPPPPPPSPAPPSPSPPGGPQPPQPPDRTPAKRQPPPPSFGGFPFCKCDTTPASMPFTLAGAPSLSRSASGQNLYCFTLNSAACADPDSPCCASTLLKVEWYSYDTCRGSVRAFIDRMSYPVTWDKGGTFRLTKLNYTPADIAGKPKQLCIELRRDGPCDTIDKFCRGGRCIYSLFDTATRSCCPTTTTPWAR
ncbi:Perphorin-2 [Tetrabaena socialis]|uniref:Perphorin-2 n=1 Tax=Tetrabaena socialis TaxID=47790 RepID=A0A2J8A3J0_9CHLO|nr:Perphorin-2 [Tetrabaena socialis]|eukprot:PNH07073.1 Perphorin-2 [Tetrabaena socialis]